MSATYNPVIHQNATWEITVTITTPAGSPMNLLNYTGQSSIRATYDSTVALATPVVTITDAPNGVLKVKLDLVQSALLEVTPSPVTPKVKLPVWDVLIGNADHSTVLVVLSGDVTVKPGVTHWA